MRWLVFASGLLLPLAASANGLMKVYDLALTNDPTYLAAQFARDANVEARPLALAPLLPQLNGAYRPAKDHFEFTPPDASTCAQAGQPAGCTFTSSNRPYTVSLTLSQSIFDWSAFESY